MGNVSSGGVQGGSWSAPPTVRDQAGRGGGDGFKSPRPMRGKPLHVLTVTYRPAEGKHPRRPPPPFRVLTDLPGEPPLDLTATLHVESVIPPRRAGSLDEEPASRTWVSLSIPVVRLHLGYDGSGTMTSALTPENRERHPGCQSGERLMFLSLTPRYAGRKFLDPPNPFGGIAMVTTLVVCCGLLFRPPRRGRRRARPPTSPPTRRPRGRQRRRGDADAHVRLALWCEAHGLPAERLKHLAIAALIEPGHVTARG